jgi:hypothetical protein
VSELAEILEWHGLSAPVVEGAVAVYEITHHEQYAVLLRWEECSLVAHFDLHWIQVGLES